MDKHEQTVEKVRILIIFLQKPQMISLSADYLGFCGFSSEHYERYLSFSTKNGTEKQKWTRLRMKKEHERWRLKEI